MVNATRKTIVRKGFSTEALNQQNTNSSRKRKWGVCLVFSLAAQLSLLGLGGCANMQRWQEHKKEHNNPQPTRYEAPYNQIRETTEPNFNVGQSVADLPDSSQTKPEVIEPSPYIPGKSPILYAIRLKDKPGFVLSPYAPDKGLVDVRGFPAGGDVRDPYTGQIMKVPFEEASSKAPEETDLVKPSADMPLPLTDSPPMLRP